MSAIQWAEPRSETFLETLSEKLLQTFQIPSDAELLITDRFVDKANKKTNSAAVEAAAVQLSEAFGVALDDARRAVEQCNGASQARYSNAHTLCLL